MNTPKETKDEICRFLRTEEPSGSLRADTHNQQQRFGKSVSSAVRKYEATERGPQGIQSDTV